MHFFSPDLFHQELQAHCSFEKKTSTLSNICFGTAGNSLRPGA